MAWVAVDKNGEENIFSHKPTRNEELDFWYDEVKDGGIVYDTEICLPKGSIKKLIGKDLTWQDKPHRVKGGII